MWSSTQPLSGSLWNDKKAYHLEKNVDWKKEKEKEKEEKWDGKGKDRHNKLTVFLSEGSPLSTMEQD